MNQLTEKSEIVICKKRERIVTTFTQCELSTVLENVAYHRMEMISYFLNINKYDKITVQDCDHIFKLINDEIIIMYDKFFSPHLMSIALCSDFDLGELPSVTYKIFNARNLVDKEYIQHL